MKINIRDLTKALRDVELQTIKVSHLDFANIPYSFTTHIPHVCSMRVCFALFTFQKCLQRLDMFQ